MRILLVEDEPAVQGYVLTILEKAGHMVVTETNGNRAFRRYCKEGPFDLVLTDIEHKGMNGVELMHTINRKDQKAERQNHYRLARFAKTIQTKAIA